jgi:hypothetical protein
VIVFLDVFPLFVIANMINSSSTLKRLSKILTEDISIKSQSHFPRGEVFLPMVWRRGRVRGDIQKQGKQPHEIDPTFTHRYLDLFLSLSSLSLSLVSLSLSLSLSHSLSLSLSLSLTSHLGPLHQ